GLDLSTRPDAVAVDRPVGDLHQEDLAGLDDRVAPLVPEAIDHDCWFPAKRGERLEQGVGEVALAGAENDAVVIEAPSVEAHGERRCSPGIAGRLQIRGVRTPARTGHPARMVREDFHRDGSLETGRPKTRLGWLAAGTCSASTSPERSSSSSD